MDFGPDLAALYAEFGTDISVAVDGATQTARGYFTAPGAAALSGAGISNDYTIELSALSLPSIRAGATVTISGTSYKVREIWPIDDGSVRRLTLRKV
jgi:hypothetical protein